MTGVCEALDPLTPTPPDPAKKPPPAPGVAALLELEAEAGAGDPFDALEVTPTELVAASATRAMKPAPEAIRATLRRC